MAKKKNEASEDVPATASEQPTMASGIVQDTPAPETRKRKSRAKSTEAAPTSNVNMTLEELASKFLAHLEDVGKSNGTLFSYKLELITALDEIGKDTIVAELTPTRVLEYFTSDRVMRTRTGVEKARPTYLKTQRVLRLALVWAQDTGLIAKAPLQEDAATF